MLCFSGCNNAESTSDPTPAPDGITESEDAVLPDNSVSEGGEIPVDAPENDEYGFGVAQMMIDHPVDELYALIGKPNDSSYASSCMGDGEDGELYYDGFTVCTYLEGDTETVVDVYK